MIWDNMRYYAGNKVCPGCGVPGYKKRRETVDSLCYECEIYIRKGKAQSEAEKAANSLKCGKYCVVHFNDNAGRYLSNGDMNRGFTSLLYQIGEKFHDKSKETKGETVNIGRYNSRRYKNYLVLPEEIANLLEQIATSVTVMGNAHYEEGKKYGVNLLEQLNNNEVTPDDFLRRLQ